jgi:aspartyl-tRNA(Asn)/glutamyl-tRNA(Gln) amidotransferase subunit A
VNAARTWQGDVVSLVEAFRSSERSPVDEVRATLAAIESSDLNAFSFVDAEGALERAEAADVSLPLGGVPIGVKELHQVEGWPDTHASLLFADRTAPGDGTMVARLKAASRRPVSSAASTAPRRSSTGSPATPGAGMRRRADPRAAAPPP